MLLSHIINNNFRAAFGTVLSAKIPVKTSWKLRNISKKLDENLKLFNESREDLVKKLATKDDAGIMQTEDLDGQKSYVFSEENKKEFLREMESLQSIDVKIEKIKIEELGDIFIEPMILIYLGDLLKD